MNSDEVLDWIHFANTTSSAKWEHTFKAECGKLFYRITMIKSGCLNTL